jgi:polysaccharide deacetylase 2 family uncharacterized protein YibQ
MAPQSKKNSKRPSTKKRKKSRKFKKVFHSKQNIFIVVALFFFVSLVVFGYYLGQSSDVSTQQQEKLIEKKKHPKVVKDLSKIQTAKLPKPQNIVVAQKNVKKEKEQNIALAYQGKKPRLVIIIDDVHTKAQLQAIEKLKMKITPSVFPPYQLAKHSNLLAKNLKHYMIHLPMESGSRQFNKQTKTLMTSFSDERIADRVMEIRQLFPKAKYVNNHTGSVFTSNYKAMKKLYIALKLEGFTFVDSFTAATSIVRKIAHEFGDAYVRRDVFIDNMHTVSYIHKQLKRAVAKAKKSGYAVAIGHPHKITMQALASSKQLLKDVELVYIDEIYAKR